MKKMIQKFQKSFAVVAVAALLVGAVPARAAEEPKSPSGKGRVDLSYIGTSACRSNQTATQKFCVAGSGLLYELCAFGTAVVAGKGAMAFDTVSATQWGGGSPNFQTTYGISPIVYGTAPAAVAGNEAYRPRCWAPAHGPQRFENGLGILADDASVSIIARYRLDSGTNP